MSKNHNMKSIRVFLTDTCNASCPNCLNSNLRKNKSFIDVSRYNAMCNYFRDNGIERMRLMGGEPTLHPEFLNIVETSKKYFNRITIFTNGKSDSIKDVILRDSDAINFNFSFAKYITEEKLVACGKGKRVLSIILTQSTSTENTINDISRIRHYYKNIAVSLSFDCRLNIFKYRRKLLEVFYIIHDYCIENQIEIVIDHALPLCFLYGSHIPTPNGFSLCKPDCYGVVDSNYNVRPCNLSSDATLPLFQDEKIIPFQLIENFFLLEHYKTQVKVLEKICSNCPLYSKHCNGGCYMKNDMITVEDIIQNTDFPIL